MSATEPITDAEVVPEAMALAAREPQHEVSLWSTTDPVEVIQQATRLADAYKDVVKSKGLIANIRGREHPQVEAWQLLGSMLGVHPVPVGEPSVLPWPEPVPSELKTFHDRGMAFGFSAAYTAVKGGEVVGGGQSRCSRTEKTWKDRDDFALASMAQTRAISKALSGPLRFVMTLAGYEATPADEMPSDAPRADPAHPHGPEVDADLKAQIGPAVLKILGGDEERARSAYKQITVDLGVNYMPAAAARALVTVANALDDLPWTGDLPEAE